MKKKRAGLELILLNLFKKYNADKEVYKKLTLELKDRMYTSRIAGVFDTNISITLISDDELCLITQGLYIATNKRHSEIEPEKWFLKVEIETANAKEINSEVEDFIIFRDLIRKPSEFRDLSIDEKPEDVDDYENEWIGYVSYGEIKRAWEQGFLTYNQSTQRAGKIVELFGNTYIVPTISKKNVSAIKNRMLKKEFHTNMLTFNVTSNNTEKIVYNAKNRDLKVTNSEIAVADGAHRLLSIVRAVDEKPELARQYTAVMIKNLPISLAQQFINQEAQGLRQDARTLALVDGENVVNKFCRNLNKEIVDNELYKKIGMNISEYDKCLIPLPKLMMALEDNFEDIFACEDAGEIDKLKEYIIEFFNIIIGTYSTYYKGDIEELKERYITYTSNFTVGLIRIAGKLYGTDDWYKKLINILENIDWNKDNPVWKENKVKSSTLSNTSKKQIYKFFEELV